MKTVVVVPLSKKIRKDELSYFTAKQIEPGMIVKVPVRSKSVDALVIETATVAMEKSKIKTSTFELKKIEEVKGYAHFSKAFFRACTEMQKYFRQTGSVIFGSLLPNVFLEQYGTLHKRAESTENENKILGSHEKLIFQAPLLDRFSFYRTLIREAFARKQSVFICLPTIADIKIFQEHLGKGIDLYTLFFHSELTKKELIANYNRVIDEVHPILIIGTASYLSIPRSDLSTLILERESSGAYRTFGDTPLDMRIFAEVFAYEQKLRFIIADTLLRVETMWRYDTREITEITQPVFRTVKEIRQTIVNPKEEIPEPNNKKIFTSITKQVTDAINIAHQNGKNVFLFTLRTGLATMTRCRDCGEILACETCKGPLVLYERAGKRVFRCNYCKQEFPSEQRCRNCGNWNLAPLGIGADFVFTELKKNFSDIPLFRIDRETVKTGKQAAKVVREFKRTPGALLLGTEMALFYLDESVDTTAVISFDSLFNIPSFRINERILELLVMLRAITSKELLIQTRNPDDPILEVTNNGSMQEWYRQELKDRERFGYPPFRTLIKIRFLGKPSKASAVKKKLEEIFAGEEFIILDSIARKGRTQSFHCILKVARERWSPAGLVYKGVFDEALSQKLEKLGPEYGIEVNPEDLF